MEGAMHGPSPLRAAADAFAEQSGSALERMVIHRNGNEAWFTITGDAAFYYAVLTLRERQHAVDISPSVPHRKSANDWAARLYRRNDRRTIIPR